VYGIKKFAILTLHMKFQVPQFIDMEDKIFGPLSFKEFIYVLGGVGISYILYRFIPITFLAFVCIIPVLSFSIALAFYKPNNKPFIDMVQSSIIFFFGQKQYLWKKQENKQLDPDASLYGDIPPVLTHRGDHSLSEEQISQTKRELDINNDEKRLKTNVKSKLNINV